MTDVAVVVPVYDNAATLRPLVERCRRAVPGVSIVLVDDGCTRGSGSVAAALAMDTPGVTSIAHVQNLGQQWAIRSGLGAVDASMVVVLDADLQDPPEAMPVLLDRLRARDVEAVFAGRRGLYETPVRRLGGMAHRIALAVTLGLPVDAGGFVAMTRTCTDAVLALDGPPQLVAMIGRTGLPTTSVPVRRSARSVGGSSIGAGDRLRHAASALPHIRRTLSSRFFDDQRSNHDS